jgi:Pyridoxal phosphate biosynthesis protein PdxJ
MDIAGEGVPDSRGKSARHGRWEQTIVLFLDHCVAFAGAPLELPTLPLSVNLNRVALPRNSRRIGASHVLRFAVIAYKAWADGITVYPWAAEHS